MNILLFGGGRMGRILRSLAEESGHTVLDVIDVDNLDALDDLEAADAVLDFSSPAALPSLAAYVERTGSPLCCGTTGYGPEEMKTLRELGRFAPVLYSANYSLGIAVLRKLLAQASQVLLPDFDVEITETHHRKKADAPSGTAKLLADAIDPEKRMPRIEGRGPETGPREEGQIGVSALRGGTVAGEHTVYFFGEDEVFSLHHSAASRRIFAVGALRAAAALSRMPAGFYTLDQVLFGEE
ncbi:MAG: 4-hydroxy-tetrahydrodipicolinate reductase [Bacillota bacterium]|nr:4-hydroxy-tetrahydrodipicolinate reductase [Bacillota bacterium]